MEDVVGFLDGQQYHLAGGDGDLAFAGHLLAIESSPQIELGQLAVGFDTVASNASVAMPYCFSTRSQHTVSLWARCLFGEMTC